jgi:hypothetical protein
MEGNSLHHIVSTEFSSWRMLQLCFFMSNMPYVRYSLGGCASYLCEKHSCTKQNRFQHKFLNVTFPNTGYYWTKEYNPNAKVSEKRCWIISVIDLNIRLKYPSDTLQRRQEFQKP